MSHRRVIQLLLVLFAAVLTSTCDASRSFAAVQAPRPAASAAGPIVVHNAYYPKPGLEDEVYRLRLRASAVRAQLGLVEGRVLRRIEASNGAPYVIWEADYADSNARERDVARLSTSAEFDSIAKHMGTLLIRFERSTWQAAPSTRQR